MRSPDILCVTLNPCLDKTLITPAWKPGDNVRGTALREVVGGKGNNVARALNGLGQLARPATFLGGPTGTRCEYLLHHDDRMSPIIIETDAETRTILTVRTGNSAEQSAFFDPDPAISETEAALLIQAIRREMQFGLVSALTLSGSSPSPGTHRVYGELINQAREFGVMVLLDTYGMALKSLGSAVPDVIQLNRKEVAGMIGVELDDLSEIQAFDWLGQWIGLGASLAVLTQGPDAVLAVSRQGKWRALPPQIQPVNPIGSGDCFLAGLTMSKLLHESDEANLRFAVACAVANARVWDAGAITIDQVATWAPLISVERV